MTKIGFPYLVMILCLSLGIQEANQGPSDTVKQYLLERQSLEDSLSASLEPIVQECRDQGLGEVASLFLDLVIVRDPQRQYIFLPPENRIDDDRLPEDIPPAIRKKAKRILNDHAEALFELAKTEAANGNGAVAFQLLHEVLFFAPNHDAVRKILGHKIASMPSPNGTDTEHEPYKAWQVSSDRLKFKRSSRAHSELGWPAKTWSTASTAHFQIDSQATEAETEILARSLEKWHDVWRQVFFEYYNRSANVHNWIDGKGSLYAPRRKFNVVFFANRDDYMAGLSKFVPGIEASTGYYNDQEKTSYFFASDDPTIHDTWRHEMAHQLFQESQRSVISPFQDDFLWLGEGIAMYFESLTDRGDLVTLGGFDSRRLQYARLRRIREQFYIPLEQLSKLNRVEFQSQPELAKVYSQSAGVTHYLMNSNEGELRRRLIDFLQMSYQGKLKAGSFEKILGKSFAEMDAGYAEFLKIQPGQLGFLSAPTTITELSLVAAPLQDDSLAKVGKCMNLDWLDLSACDVRGHRLSYLKSCKKLQQLLLTGAILDAESIRSIVQLPIRELDLSGSNVTDQDLEALADSQTLESLNLAGTATTEKARQAIRSKRPKIKVVSD